MLIHFLQLQYGEGGVGRDIGIFSYEVHDSSGCSSTHLSKSLGLTKLSYWGAVSCFIALS
ncbi:hypothetical protein CH063_10313 [Colletotrichum higginsianum]|uniref:Uncharacterized protein n=1 Tax=Colletotrichum higginsianum (strain IMI 349063) TaxID=759273 RepID=H1VGZ2_COLHI|nr:hypothetical protein CH063_10313 [Colletotrichum higginsianum]